MCGCCLPNRLCSSRHTSITGVQAIRAPHRQGQRAPCVSTQAMHEAELAIIRAVLAGFGWPRFPSRTGPTACHVAQKPHPLPIDISAMRELCSQAHLLRPKARQPTLAFRSPSHASGDKLTQPRRHASLAFAEATQFPSACSICGPSQAPNRALSARNSWHRTSLRVPPPIRSHRPMSTQGRAVTLRD